MFPLNYAQRIPPLVIGVEEQKIRPRIRRSGSDGAEQRANGDGDSELHTCISAERGNFVKQREGAEVRLEVKGVRNGLPLPVEGRGRGEGWEWSRRFVYFTVLRRNHPSPSIPLPVEGRGTETSSAFNRNGAAAKYVFASFHPAHSLKPRAFDEMFCHRRVRFYRRESRA